MTRTLVAFYSSTGHTRKVAELTAAALGADLEEIVDPVRRTGAIGMIRSSFAALLKRPAKIGPSTADPTSYDLVVVGTPVWASSLSTPALAYLARHRDRLPSVAFFYTSGSEDGDRPFAQMAAAAGKKPVATLAVPEAELAAAALAVQRFALAIEQAGAPPRPARGSTPAPGAPVPVT